MVMLLREPARPAVVREHRLAPWLAVATVCFGARGLPVPAASSGWPLPPRPPRSG
jgi:hypothetical protein